MTNFNIGNLITGKPNNRYAYTTSKSLMIVTKCFSSDIRVYIVAADVEAHVGEEFTVDPNRFVSTTEEEFFFKYPDAYKCEDYNMRIKANGEVIPELPETNFLEKFIADKPKYKLGEHQFEQFFERGKRVLWDASSYECDYNPTRWGMSESWRVYKENKVNLLTLFSQHPEWDDEKLLIHQIRHLSARVNKDAIRDFCDFLDDRAREWYRNNNLDRWDIRTNNLFYGIRWVKNYHEPEVNEEFAKRLEEYASLEMPEFVNPKTGEVHKKKLGIQKGMKTTKAVQKFFALYGFDKYKSVVVKEWTDDGGRVHTREKDYGWAEYYSHIYCDAMCGQKEKDMHFYISLNPLDYWLMSEGNGWTSCHSIYKGGHNGFDGEYNGCYSSGGDSYMHDGTSFIVYTTKITDPTEEPWLNQKVNRCVFNFGQDKLVQGRTYPDGRDGGSKIIVEEMRHAVQEIITYCLGIKNDWKLKRGTVNWIQSYGTHYRDYRHYDDCTLSIIKAEGYKTNTKMFPVGHDPICPECGIEHHTEEYLTCPTCRGVVTCERCGSIIDPDEAIYDEDTEFFYCDEYCAERDDVYYCVNVDEWHSENVRYDDYAGQHFLEDYDTIITEDGHAYMNAENAMNDDYEYIEEEDGWYHASEIRYCEHCDRYVLRDNYDEEHDCCNNCLEELEKEEEEETA